MKAIDLFAGCGGLSLGFKNVGYDIRAAFDYWKPALKTYRANFDDHSAIELDLSSFNGDVSPFTVFEPEIVIGGPPCQDFSSAGKRDETQGRADLTVIYAKIVSQIGSKWFVMENVERAVKSDRYEKAKTILKNAGYGLTQIVLDASLCGVPQKRKRLFLIGEMNGEDKALDYYLTKNQSKKSKTLRDYFGDSLGIENYYRHPRSYQRRGIFSIDEPSPTVRGVNRPIPPNYKFHSGDTVKTTENLRPLTTKERSMIQTFPNNFVFEGSKADLEQIIGNAVPVKLAEYVARCIVEYVENRTTSHYKNNEHQLAFSFA